MTEKYFNKQKHVEYIDIIIITHTLGSYEILFLKKSMFFVNLKGYELYTYLKFEIDIKGFKGDY